MILTQARLIELLIYDPGSGQFYWRQRRGGRANAAGVAAGARCRDGYLKIGIDGGRHQAHRLAWLYVYGRLPEDQIDHINGIRSDNRIANLREATNGQNQHNLARPKRGNRVGFLGVTFHPQSRKYRARLKVSKRTVDCGLHETAEEAHAAYLAARREQQVFSGAIDASEVA